MAPPGAKNPDLSAFFAMNRENGEIFDFAQLICEAIKNLKKTKIFAMRKFLSRNDQEILCSKIFNLSARPGPPSRAAPGRIAIYMLITGALAPVQRSR